MPRQASPSPERPPERPTETTFDPLSSSSPTPQKKNDIGNNNIENDKAGHDIYQHSNYVYIFDPEHSWIPALIKDRSNLNTGSNGRSNLVHLSVPQYRNEQAIRCDGGRTASRGFLEETINLADEENRMRYPNQHLPLQNVNSEGELQVVDDMVDLPFLHEAAILYNLKARHVESLPYTRTGDIILACNPYKWFHHLYNDEERDRYSQTLVWNGRSSTITSVKRENIVVNRPNHNLQHDSSSSSSNSTAPDTQSSHHRSSPNDPRMALPPHVYETGCLAYIGLLREQEDQSILVSGESGAGKTETVKILLRNLASIQEKGVAAKSARNIMGQQIEENNIVQRVLDSNPLLEAFGNATTLRNDNSSRFGKYLQLQYDVNSVSNAILAGSKCEVYLLEKSRVTHHQDSERTYHIFYQLLAAPEELKIAIWDGLKNTDVDSFCYVGATEIDSSNSNSAIARGIIEGKSDAERFQLTLQALELIGVRGEILQMLLRAICVVLQLGNIEFVPAQSSSTTAMSKLGVHECYGMKGDSHDGNHDVSDISSIEELQELSDLLGMNDIDESSKISKVLKKSLTVRNLEARGEVFAVPLTPAKAKESADAFAKEIYAKTFLWLVRTINDATCAERNYHQVGFESKVQTQTKFGIIGLLDIFGFETFEKNRFEQLCINYCNEKLQQKFTQDIFRSVQVEYENEGIELEEITYDDNTEVLDLVEGRMGLLAFLNEECVRPKGSDKTFVYKAQAMNKDNRCFFRDKHAADTEFGIYHYAGKVLYDATNFVTKNNDTLPSDLLKCAKLSSNAIIANELTNEDMMNKSFYSSTTGVGGSKKKKRPKSLQSLNSQQLKKRTSNIAAETVWTKFKGQLFRLMETLSGTKTRYIRCIKPNSKKAPLIMEHTSTVEQLRCAGVVAAVTISRSAFPNRLNHTSVLDRFKSLWPKGDHFAILRNDSLDIGERNKKATNVLLTLALREMEFEKKGSKYQAFVMGKTRAYFRAGALEFLETERMKFLGTYAIVIQTSIRRCIVKSKYIRFRQTVIKLQAHHRQTLQRRIYLMWRQAAARIQCWFRVIFAVHKVYHLRRFIRATTIQTQWRIYCDKRKLQVMIKATVAIQAMVRGCLQRPKYRQALIEKKEEAKLENQLRSLQRKLEEAESKRLEAEKEAEGRVIIAVEEYKEREAQKVKDPQEAKAKEETAALEEPEMPVEKEIKMPSDECANSGQQQVSVQDLTIEQQQLMDESGKMLEHLRKEVFRLRSQNQQLKTDFDLLKENNQRLMDANASAGASFAALNQHAKQLSKQNAKLVHDVQNYKGQVHKLNILQVEAKEELRLKSATYVAEVQSRLEYQKALQKITDIIQEGCRDHRLVERVLTVADEVEMDFIPGSHERPVDPTGIDTGNDSRGGILSYFFS